MPPKTLTLKQRLAAITQAQSPTTSEPPTPRSPATPNRRRFNPHWLKRGNSQDGYGTQTEEDKVQEAMGKMIYQAGVDYETRPMVIMNASAMPDVREVNYDILLSRILSYLDLYVESDYTVVFFAAGNKHSPGWNWMWKAYRSLSRKFRKNLKRLFIVHSNFFSKMLFSLAGAFISPKFFRKITYVDTLSELAYSVPLTQIDVPPAVYQENLKHERQITLPMAIHASLFGVPLEDIMGYDGEKGGIPRVVKDCIQYLRETGMTEEGLFRRSPNSALLRQAQEAYDRGNVVSMDTFADPHLAAVLLKKYLRDLPDPLFPETLYPIIQKCPTPTDDPTDWSSLLYIRDTLLPELPRCNYILLSHVLHLMHEVSLRASMNLMGARNLSVVLCPNLVKSPSPIRDVMMCAVPGPSMSSPPLSTQSQSSPRSPQQAQEGRTTLGMVIKLCISRYYEVFDEIVDRTEALPPRIYDDETAPSPASSSGSSSPRVRGTNLRRQSLLSNSNSGHRDSKGFDDDEDIDDAMLIMPLGPEVGSNRVVNGGGSRPGSRSTSPPPPTAWGSNGNGPATSPLPYRPRQRSTPHSPSAISPSSSQGSHPPTATRSLHTALSGGNGGGNGYGSASKAKSTISIEKGLGHGGTMKKGSISIGRGGSVRHKGIGAGVEAHGITASGFFSPPPGTGDVPPLPSLPKDFGGLEK